MQNDEVLEIPHKVLRTTSFFLKHGIWHQVTINEKALTCADATAKRVRNNQIGIPLSDELKTYFGEYRAANGKPKLVLINLQGDCRIDFKTIRGILNTSQNISLASKSTMDFFKIGFGEVNPFLIYEMFSEAAVRDNFEGLVTIFDNGLLGRQATMMTNAGELTWGIEFKVEQVIAFFDNVIYDKLIIEPIKNE